MLVRGSIGAFLLLTALSSAAWADPAADYLRDVKPVLESRCYACHGALQQRSGLRLDTAARLKTGGDSGPAVEPGRPDASLVVLAVTGDGMTRMPLEGQPLEAGQIEALRRWIAAGAPEPPDERPQPRPEDHWAFQPPQRPSVPPGDGSPIDAFLGAAQVAAGVTAVAPAPPEILLRRVYLDLIGVPPSRDQLLAFLADPSPANYARVVDELLASPLYGQRWGRHWMDIWRYSDWAGYGAEVRDSQQHIWHWRDWIVDSLNADVGYDQMIREMLAGDELAPTDPKVLRATGYLARNWYRFNRNVWLDNTVEHTGKAFLGLTFNCARCHDHKYDPIAQEDYYRLRAYFEPHQVRTDRLPGQPDVNLAGIPRAYDADLGAQTFVYLRGNEAEPDKDRPLAPGLPGLFAAQAPPIEPIPLPAAAYYPGVQSFVRAEALAAAHASIAGASDDIHRRAAEAALACLEARIAADDARYAAPPSGDATEKARRAQQLEREAAVAACEAGAAAAHAELAAATMALKPDDETAQARAAKAQDGVKEASEKLAAARNLLAAPLDGAYTPLTQVFPATSSGRRLALARWIADGRNPLTARVAVNHIWLRHFGTALVESVFDFGHHGARPKHRELLDWLAVEFVARGWSMKHLHRLMVTSQTYARASGGRAADAATLAADPDNSLLWRMNPRRMEAEVVRDSVLYLAGRLDLSLGGPEIPHGDGLTVTRRSLYFQHANEKQMTFLKLFDAAAVTECYRRTESIVPQQGLALANSALVREQARRVAAKIGARPADEFVAAAFEYVLARRPRHDERQACLAFLTRQAELLADPHELTGFPGPQPQAPASPDPAMRAREDLVHVLMNHNDFVTIR